MMTQRVSSGDECELLQRRRHHARADVAGSVASADAQVGHRARPGAQERTAQPAAEAAHGRRRRRAQRQPVELELGPAARASATTATADALGTCGSL